MLLRLRFAQAERRAWEYADGVEAIAGLELGNAGDLRDRQVVFTATLVSTGVVVGRCTEWSNLRPCAA